MVKILKLLRRVQKKKTERSKNPIYDICLVKKSSHGRKTYEKLGIYSVKNNYFKLNIFRLIFWLSKNISISGNCVYYFMKFNVLSALQNKKNAN